MLQRALFSLTKISFQKRHILNYKTRSSLLQVLGGLGIIGGSLWFAQNSNAEAQTGRVAKQIINDPEFVVEEMLEGFTMANPKVVLLEGMPGIKVVRRRDWEASSPQVAIISGGGSGHEPSHAGFVGEGMLTAAVAGDVFSSPSTEAILAAIRSVATEAGVLLVVKNYTGDRLNFGMAAEQAKSEGIKIEMVVVADDCALPNAKGIVGRRGISGTIFVHKVAGSAASAGLSLESVAEEARATAESVGSIGIALTPCTLPTQSIVSDRLSGFDMELGMGIHGESGLETSPLKKADQIVDAMIDKLLNEEEGRSSVKLDGKPVAIIVNNLGTATQMEMNIVTKRVLGTLAERGIRVFRICTGTLMTSLDMRGVSISILPLTDLTLARLDSPTDAPGWIQMKQPVSSSQITIPVTKGPVLCFERPKSLTQKAQMLENAIINAAKSLLAATADLDRMDKLVGDGDCGSTLAKGAMAILDDVKSNYPLNNTKDTLLALSESIKRSMGGTSGALYSILFKAAAVALDETEVAADAMKTQDSNDHELNILIKTLDRAIQSVQQYGGAKPGFRTMLDALVPACETLKHAQEQGHNFKEAIQAAAIAAENGANRTRDMEAMAGRSSYIPLHILHSTPDPGSVAVALWIRAIVDSMNQ